MTKAIITFKLLSYWHAGTSHGEGAELDATVARTAAGLPYLPGRTVKGLLRFGTLAAEQAEAVDPGRTEALFGTDVPAKAGDDRERKLEERRFQTRPGTLRFESAVLVDAKGDRSAWERYAAEKAAKSHVEHLFAELSSTAIDKDGVAQDQSLRSIEVTVPVTLVAEVSGPADDAGWIDALREGALFLHGLGVGRNRGLGRVEVSVERMPEEEPAR